MKKIILIMTLLLLTMTLVSAQDYSYLAASVTSYEPQPASPGKYVTVYVKIENNGSQAARNVVLEAVPEFPFSISNGQKMIESIGTIPAHSFHVAEFNVYVHPDAVQGDNVFKVRYNLNSEKTAFATKELNINVQTLDAILSINSVATQPEQIPPGSLGQVTLSIENMADSLLTDIKVTLGLDDDDIPIAPKNGATEKNIYQLMSGEIKTLTYDVVVFPDAESKIYKVPITLNYFDNVGNEYTTEDIIALTVNSEPEIVVMVDSTSLLKDKKTGSVILKIVNKGLNDVKLMTLTMESGNGFELLSATNKEYIGNIDSDDFETVEFDLLLDETDSINIPLTLEYRDNVNKEFKESLSLNLKIHSQEDLGQEKGNGLVIALVVVIVVVGVIIYRRRKKK